MNFVSVTDSPEFSVTKETLSENVCHLFDATRGCRQGFNCENQDGKPVCVYVIYKTLLIY
ncbi:hypothetical protein DPMN_112700 [Dreissena polymorpha]|uniref:Uncharacterized protein n=1 Tax=Dreissena polymorpha TaxID=45954 RepID=A0A9D4KGW9_DREPO|nr:hypothetical protein DPMN_112700 [Dreissena polymorpha]